MIDRSQDARHSVGPIGARHRQYVWTSRRGPHLGQRSSATAKTGRTYDRKRSDRTRLQKLLQPRGRPHMGPRLREDDSRESLLHIFSAGTSGTKRRGDPNSAHLTSGGRRQQAAERVSFAVDRLAPLQKCPRFQSAQSDPPTSPQSRASTTTRCGTGRRHSSLILPTHTR